MVSVIIITYKRTNTITRAIDSVLKQTFSDFELIVVDDNNPDTVYRKDLELIMSRYSDEPKVKYIQHEYNKNGSAARNTGISAAKGDYIAFLDDDDYYLPNRLEDLVKALDNNTDYQGVYSSVIVEKNRKIVGLVEAKVSGNLKDALLLDSFAFGTGSNLFFRTNAVKELKGFDTTFKRHQDIEFMIRFFNTNQLLAVYAPSVVKVQDDRGNEPDTEQYIEIKKHYIKAFQNDIQALDSDKKALFYGIKYRQILETSIRKKEYRRYFNLRKRCKKQFPLSFKNNIRFLSLFINNYIKLDQIKYSLIRRKVKSSFKNEVNAMREIHNSNWERG